MNQPVNWLRRLSILALAAVTVALLALSFQAGLASLYYFPAQFRLEQWEKSTDKPTSADLAHTAELIANAVRLQPDNPHYLLLSAKVNEWRWYSGELSSAQIKANEQLYQQAIALRPSWPVAYADYAYFLAVTQFRLTDAWQQLQLATERGAYLPQVQQKFLSVAFSFWQSLSVQQKAEVYRRVELGFAGALFEQTRRAVEQAGKQSQICRYLRLKQDGQPVWQKVRQNVCVRYQ
jgi:hypothetical protein